MYVVSHYTQLAHPFGNAGALSARKALASERVQGRGAKGGRAEEVSCLRGHTGVCRQQHESLRLFQPGPGMGAPFYRKRERLLLRAPPKQQKVAGIFVFAPAHDVLTDLTPD